jgi:hypothetical protein
MGTDHGPIAEDRNMSRSRDRGSDIREMSSNFIGVTSYSIAHINRKRALLDVHCHEGLGSCTCDRDNVQRTPHSRT